MKQHNAYAAGRKAYGGGRSNPTSGTVNPTGYIDRAANKQASQRRSGLAKMALSRRLGTGTTAPRNVITAPGTPDAPAPAATPTGQVYTDPATGLPNPYADYSSQPDPGPGDIYQPPPSNPLARDSSGNVGHITPGDAAAGQAANDWQPPVDPLQEAADAEAEAERQQYLVDLAGQENDFRTAAGRRLRDLEAQKPIAHEQLLGDFAGRGLAYSGRYVKDRGDLENRFASEATSTNEDLNSHLEQIARARAGKNAQIKALLNKNLAESAARNANNPAFRAPVAPSFNFAPSTGSGEDELAIEAIKRRLAAGA